ncbi:MAG TPA: hypothetical protein VG943_09490 [Caulobacterales bacterium]|nr:hypothetical protein [Caulobacterales bacterium]
MLFQDGTFADVIARLRAAGDERDFDAAQMQLINLPEVIASVGSQWPKVKAKLGAASVSFLKGCLDETDVVIPAGDGFLIIFDKQADPAQLKARAEELRGLLLEFYRSQEELRELGLAVEMRRISSSDLRGLLSAPQAPSRTPPQHRMRFAPMWSPGPQAVASYACVPVFEDRSGERFGYDRGYAEEGENSHRDYCELDLRGLELVQKALQGYDLDRAVPAVGVSVHSTTMQNRLARSAFLERLARLPQARMKYAFVRIAEIENGAPLITLADWCGMLRARVRNILLEFHHSTQAPPNLSQIGVWGAGYRLPRSASREGADSSAVSLQFQRWALGLGRQRAVFFVDDLRRPGLIQLAAGAGARFITSDNFWPLLDTPGGVYGSPAPQGPTVSKPASVAG